MFYFHKVSEVSCVVRCTECVRVTVQNDSGIIYMPNVLYLQQLDVLVIVTVHRSLICFLVDVLCNSYSTVCVNHTSYSGMKSDTREGLSIVNAH